ncbi:MAG: penicillin-binding transpeptidase domain-containing protein, partial [Ignavibacteria bacterium]
INCFLFSFILLLLLVYWKLFNIQIIDSSRYQLAAKKQYESKISLKPLRGLIFDRKMNSLVSNVNMYSFAADPNMVDNKDSAASLFASVFKKDKKYYLDKLNSNNTSFVWLERRAEDKFSSELENINLSGIIKLNEAHRVFNYDRLGSQVIGFTDIDNNGISGIEYQYDELLSGKDGYVVMQKDGLGRKRPAVEYPRMEPQNGNNLVLTIDLNIQKIVEEELENAVNANNSDGGKCVVMGVKTGEILGMYSLSSSQTDSDKNLNSSKLTVITDLYEPGSTFKIVTAAASLEEGIQNKDDIIYTHGGEYQIYGLKFKDSHSFLLMSFQQVIEQSSNVGTIQVANKLGEKRFYKYARDFGFGITTGIDLPGEIKGSLKRPVDFSPVSLKYMAIGYEVLVTAIQMTNAYACVANNGLLMKPYIIKKELSENGTVIRENHPSPVRNVISNSTARTLTELLYGVVERGTGTEAKVENMKIAGKTGTAQKLIDGKYSKSSYTSSFIGYFPAEDPRIVISVIIDAPKSDEYYGGKVAAPVFRNIAEKIINSPGLMEFLYPEPLPQDPLSFGEGRGEVNNGIINVVNLELNDAVRLLKEKNIEYELVKNSGEFDNSVITRQQIFNGEEPNSVKKIKLFTGGVIKKDSKLKMPDLIGLSLRKSIKIISSFRLPLGIDFKINGCGKVVKQFPEPGVSLDEKKHIVIYCGNLN